MRIPILLIAFALTSSPARARENPKKIVGAILVGLGVAATMGASASFFAAGGGHFHDDPVNDFMPGYQPDLFNLAGTLTLVGLSSALVTAGTPLYIAGATEQPHRRALAAGIALTFIGLAAMTAGLVTSIDSARLPSDETGGSSIQTGTQASFGLATTLAGNGLLGIGMPLLFEGLRGERVTVRLSGAGISGSF